MNEPGVGDGVGLGVGEGVPGVGTGVGLGVGTGVGGTGGAGAGLGAGGAGARRALSTPGTPFLNSASVDVASAFVASVFSIFSFKEVGATFDTSSATVLKVGFWNMVRFIEVKE